MKKNLLLGILLVLTISLVSAEYSLDIKTDKQSYSAGEIVLFQVILLDDNNPIERQVEVVLNDNLEKEQISKTATSNRDTDFVIQENYPSGVWKIKATFEGKEVTRIFTVEEKQDVEFLIQDKELIIKNTGNTPYTREITILIGEEVSTHRLNLGVGKSKSYKLLAPEGRYDIQVSDGEKTITQRNVHLTGTGQVIGALDEDILSDSPLGGPRDPGTFDKFFASSRTIVALVFIGAVFGLGVLLLIQRRLRKKV